MKCSYSACETVAMIRAVERLDPAITCLNRELARSALCREHLIPICVVQKSANGAKVKKPCKSLTILTVRLAVFQEEGVVAKWLTALRAAEAFRVPLLAQRV